MRISILTLICTLLCTISSFALEVKGKITDEQGQALVYANVFIKGTTIGTNSNIDGYYQLDLPTGKYELVFQYVGYESVMKEIDLQDNRVLDIQLAPLPQQVQEIVVTAGEDPAYRIIRNAINRRKYYLDQQNRSYQCDAYVKGIQRIENVPKSIMGQSLDELRKGLDSTGTGVVYLSESVSRIYYQKGKYKEEMISSKISGNDRGFSWNSGTEISNYSFYKNQTTIGDGKILSPIAATALGFYKYELTNSFFDEEKRLIYKIKVIPKSAEGQCYQGYIYIVDEDWAIHSTELFTTGKAVNISVLDTIYIRQTHTQLQDSSWRLFTQDIQFQINILEIKTGGRFIGIFRNFDFNPQFEKGFFDAEIFTVQDSANNKDLAYWEKVRPIPLTKEETKDYQEKDSLQKVWTSAAYLDSVDRVKNKFKFFNVLLRGYNYQNSRKKTLLSISSPLSTWSYNTVQGDYFSSAISWKKDSIHRPYSNLTLGGQIEFGIADKQIRGYVFGNFKMNDINDARISIYAGRKTMQFNNAEPIGRMANAFMTRFYKCNFLKIYDDYSVRVAYKQRLFNGLLLSTSLHYGERRALVNNDPYYFKFLYRKPLERDFFSNHPLDFEQPPMPNTESFTAHRYLHFRLRLRIRLGQKYVSYPNRRFHTPSNAPDINIVYRKGIPLLTGETNFDQLSIEFSKNSWLLGIAGKLSYSLKAAWLPNAQKIWFMDYLHHRGNQTIFARSGEYLRTYQMLPYYAYSTGQWYLGAHLEHNFNGFIWNRIPGLKKLGFEWVMSYHFLYTPERGEYMEFMLGIDRIGWKLFRFLRVDFVMSMDNQQQLNYGGVLGLKLNL